MSEPVPKQMLFVCTGNTCRSPMAEHLAAYLCRSVRGWGFASAGMFAREGAPASEGAVAVMKERGLDLREHRARQLDAGLAASVDYLIGLTQEHAELMRSQFPEMAGKIRTLHSFNPADPARDVMDPFGGSLASYRKTRDEIESALSDLILSLISTPSSTQQEPI